MTELVMHTTSKTYFEVCRVIDSAKTDVDIIGNIDKLLEVEPEYIPFDEIVIKRLNNQALESPRATRCFEGRLITKDSIKKFSLGYSEKQDMVTIPMTTPDGQTFVGFVGRSIEGKEFKNTPGLPKSKILFNLHRAKMYSTVHVVESAFDAIRLHQCGVAAVATLGANVSKKQVELLTKYFNDVIIIPDNDEAGRSMSQRIIDKMGPRAISIGLPSRFKDIGDLTDSDIGELTKRMKDPLLAMN